MTHACFHLRLRSVLAALAVAVSAASARAQDGPLFQGAGIPAPPRQNQEWIVPANALPGGVADAVAELFKEGLADPRGCEYREIQVVVGSCWGGSDVMKTHGWVLPSAEKQRFAVCWSGLVYPVVAVGEPASVKDDITAALKKDEAQLDEARQRDEQSEKQRQDEAKRQGTEYQRVDWPRRWNTRVTPEPLGIAHEALRPIKAALLLRLGETELAEKVWSQWFGVKLQEQAEDPYLTLANDWTWSLFDRAICAHIRGDDRLALASAMQLQALQPVVDATAARRGVPRRDNGQGGKAPYLGFLDQLPDLVADEQRRVKEPAYTPVLQMEQSPQGRARILALVRDLELVSARQTSQPGGVNLAGDPIVQALVKCGDDAVEPLLDCLETDRRLTRSVRFWRDFAPSRTIIGVHEAAYVALAGILQTDFFGVGSTGDSLTAHGEEGRKEVAAGIRAYWKRFKGLTLQERWYEVLRDDKAPPGQWLEAADNIVQDSDVDVQRSSMFGGGWTSLPARTPGQVVPMRGEPLRAKTNPGVSDLLLKRISATAPDPDQTQLGLALALAKWDGKNHFEDLRKLTAGLAQRFSSPQNRDSAGAGLLRLYQARIDAGDPKALSEYAAWVVTVPREGLGFLVDSLFEILWQHPADPDIRGAAHQLFEDPSSPWVPLIKKSAYGADSLFRSPLVGLPEFRTELRRGLADKSPAGSATIESSGYVNVSVDNGWSGGGGGSWLEDKTAPPVGTLVHFRMCDLYAQQLSGIEGFPKFEFYWPESQREQAIAACLAHLQHYGDLYQYLPQDRYDYEYAGAGRPEAQIHFPRLDRPATPDDVAQNRAIFALDGQRRVWKLPQFPMRASWATLRDNPEQGVSMVDGKAKDVIVYATEGRVFQAEEVLVDGKWRRYFGFVGPFHLAKVPASEIEFPATIPMGAIGRELEAGFTGPGSVQQYGGEQTVNFFPGDPLPMTLKVRNCGGVDQALPGVFLQPTSDHKALPHGVSLSLGYSSTVIKIGAYAPASAWTPVAPWKENIVADAQPDGPTLAPTQDVAVMTFDPRDFFDLRNPGTYKLEAHFKGPGGLTGTSAPAFFTISPKRP